MEWNHFINVLHIGHWLGHRDQYPSLTPSTLDFISASASEAYSLNAFSVYVATSLLGGEPVPTTEAALQQRIFLKSNLKFL